MEYAPPPDVTTKTTTKTTTVEEVPQVVIPNTKTVTTVVEEVPASADYIIKSAGAFKSVPVIAETTVIEPTTKKVIKTTETIKPTK